MLRSILAIIAGVVVLIGAAMLTDTLLLKLFPGATDARGRVASSAVAFLMMSYALAYCVFAAYVAATLARRREVAHGAVGDVVLVSGRMFTGRDAVVRYRMLSRSASSSNSCSSTRRFSSGTRRRSGITSRCLR